MQNATQAEPWVTVKTRIYPALASDDDSEPVTVALPCAIALKFQIDEEVNVLPRYLEEWGVSVEELKWAAGENAFQYNTYRELAPEVYAVDSQTWLSVALYPDTYIEHNWVTGRHLLFVVDTENAILTGTGVEDGLARIRAGLETSLADAPLVINRRANTWERYDLNRAET